MFPVEKQSSFTLRDTRPVNQIAYVWRYITPCCYMATKGIPVPRLRQPRRFQTATAYPSSHFPSPSTYSLSLSIPFFTDHNRTSFDTTSYYHVALFVFNFHHRLSSLFLIHRLHLVRSFTIIASFRRLVGIGQEETKQSRLGEGGRKRAN